MTEYEDEEDFEGKLDFVTLKDDNLTMLINGEVGFPVALPKSISVKNKREDKLRIVEKKILDGCNMDNIAESHHFLA